MTAVAKTTEMPAPIEYEPQIDASAYTLGKQLMTDRHHGWRSLYPIYESNILLGFLGLPSGWGKSWVVMPLRFATGTTGAFEGFQPNSDTCSGRHYISRKESFAEIFTGGYLGAKFSKRKDFKSAVEMHTAKLAIEDERKQQAREARETFRKAFKEYEARANFLEELRAGRVDTAERLAILDKLISEARERMLYFAGTISRLDKELGENQ